MKVNLANNAGNLIYKQQQGCIRIGWASLEPLELKGNDILLTLEFMVQSLPTTGTFKLDMSAGPECELADGNADVLYKTVLAMPELQSNTSDEFYMGDCYPNPLVRTGVIPFYLPREGRVVLKLTDITGRTHNIYDLGILGYGNHQFILNGNDLAAGVYFFSMDYSNAMGVFQQTKRLVMTK